ncbi:Major facilitator superfamily, general substrate transporter, oxalate/formate transporter [Desulfamplus magnetovallimortis]|uniref:Major facilitator superfamily, general substrate transporter, oxalate/formate transporter n=1 Tax=Desulfamplus magnetovallimortis TaxID=1246637 RepID=A0A1W1H4N1_9BACT|nr:OFA family MFS transporter [Desulfamplus magnetovallimortis]SLM27402.1 Major facilitator superfamily, general substrate transporter, oxalate/formate transporter [Desulfamplus magnetovallimortis]
MSTQPIDKVPTQAWITTFAGTAINLCLGILYAWSIWKAALVNVDKAGEVMTGINEGWVYLTNAQAATPFSLCVVIFALLMIPGGRIQDRISPKFGATVGGLLLAAGCIIAGMMKSYTGLIIGFGILGGAGMGIGYAAPTPAALKWFGPEKRGLVAGLVVGGYGGAALYIGWLGQKLIDAYGISGSFVALGTLFAVVVVIAGQLLKAPPEGYVPPANVSNAGVKGATEKTHNWEAGDMMKTWQFYALVFMFILTTQSGLLIISSAAGLMKKTAANMPFFVANAWILVSFGGLVNASGRVGTGYYSDKIGRLNAYCLNCGVSALCLFALPYVISTANLFLLFVVVGVAYWQYGGGLSLMPSFTADFYGAKNLGFNYGLVFIGWGFGFFMARIGGVIQDITGSLNLAFYISGGLLVLGVILARITTKPQYTG